MLDEITPVIITRDEEPNIGRTLSALTWARRVVVVDSGSSDRTLEIARSFSNVKVEERPLDDLASQWTFAGACADSEWVLTLDADYLVTPELIEEIGSMKPPPELTAYEARFVYAVRGKPLRASLYPPRLVLLRRGHFSFFMDGHTQRVRVDGETLRLHAPIIHDDRKPFARFVERQRRYMRDEAEKIRSGQASNLASRIRRLRVVAPFAVVVQTLVVKRLLLDGWPGIVYAWERFVAEAILSLELMRPRRAGTQPRGSSL